MNEEILEQNLFKFGHLKALELLSNIPHSFIYDNFSLSPFNLEDGRFYCFLWRTWNVSTIHGKKW
jgi:hypothetical protein